MSLVILGSVAFDALETPFGKTDKIIGGSATYIALAATYFTQSAKLIGVVGEDFPQATIAMLNDRGVSTEGLQIKQGEKTFFWHGRYHNDMNTRDTLVTELNVLADFDPQVPDSYQDCEFLMLGNLAPQVQLQLLKRLHKRPKLVVLDTMNLWINIARDELIELMGQVDVMVLNDEEARQLTGDYNLVKAARHIMAQGPRVVCIKKGEHGALIFDKSQVFFAPALPLEEVFDPTGAGDTFAGGFIGYLAQSGDLSFENMKRALIYGSALASFCVEKFGTERLESVTADEIHQRVGQLTNLVTFEQLLS